MTKTAAAEAAPPPAPSPLQRLELVPVARLVESPSNHRKKTWGDMKELVASIRAKGVLQPILARPVKGIGSNLLEIVFGHRRVRAAKEAGLAEVPAVVRELTDVEALEANIIENLQRADVHPMEEAEGMDELLKQKERPLTVDDLAAKVGKSKAYVYGRLKLLALCAEARKAFYDGRISASVALLVARIPTPELQEEALETVGGDEFEDPMAYRTAQDFIIDKYTLRLKDAPFDTADAQLVAGAGACSACPKRSGAQPELFADVGKDRGDVCTDTACFALKKKAAWKALQEEAKAKGATLLTEAQSKKVFGYDGKISEWGDYVSPAAKCPDDPKGRTWKQLIGDQEVEKTLAMSPKGTVVQVLDKRAAAEAVKAAGHKFKVQAPAARQSDDPEAARRAKEKAELDEKVAMRSAALIGDALDSKAPDRALWDITLDLVDEQNYGASRKVLSRRFGEKWEREWKSARPKMTAEQLRALVLDLLLTPALADWRGDKVGKQLRAWAGVDEKTLRAEVAADLKAKASAEPPAKGKKSAGNPAARELPRATAEDLAGEACLDCGVPAGQPSEGCDACDHPPAKKAGPAPLVWKEFEGTHRAEVEGGEYSILPSSGARLSWNPSWVPRSGASVVLGNRFKLTDAKADCERHAQERAADALLANAGDGKLNAKGLKGAAVARKGGRRG